MTEFSLQPEETQLNDLAKRYWETIAADQKYEQEAFSCGSESETATAQLKP